MDLVLVLLVVYVLAGLVWPQIVRNRLMFLLGAAAVALAIWIPIFTRVVEAVAFAVFVIGAQEASMDDWRRLVVQFRSLRR